MRVLADPTTGRGGVPKRTSEVPDARDTKILPTAEVLKFQRAPSVILAAVGRVAVVGVEIPAD